MVVITCLFGATSVLCAANNTKVYTVEQLLAKAPALVGKTVTVKGTCKHVCPITGRKLFLQSSDGTKLIRINAGTKIDKYDRAAIGKEVTTSGVVVEHRTTMAELDKQIASSLEGEKKQVKGEYCSCSSESKARGLDTKVSPSDQIKARKATLEKQIAAGGKNYLATYTIDESNEYAIAK